MEYILQYFFKWYFLRLSLFEVFNSNFNILNVLSQLSLKIAMHYWETWSWCIPKYLLIQNSSFQENAKTKVYALEDSLGVVHPQLNIFDGYLESLRLFYYFQALKSSNLLFLYLKMYS